MTEVVSHPEKFKDSEDGKVKIYGKVVSIVNSEQSTTGIVYSPFNPGITLIDDTEKIKILKVTYPNNSDPTAVPLMVLVSSEVQDVHLKPNDLTEITGPLRQNVQKIGGEKAPPYYVDATIVTQAQ